ncbi:MAG: type II toxin-antitoxin system PemK/MazF family toxin [Methylophilaceae bacterium]
MNRGDLITIAMQGDFGKARPALIIQSDLFNPTHPTVTVMLVSSDAVDAPLIRINVQPNTENGLKTLCQIQVDKTMTLRREKVGAVIGHLDGETMLTVNRALSVFMGIA